MTTRRRIRPALSKFSRRRWYGGKRSILRRVSEHHIITFLRHRPDFHRLIQTAAIDNPFLIIRRRFLLLLHRQAFNRTRMPVYNRNAAMTRRRRLFLPNEYGFIRRPAK